MILCPWDFPGKILEWVAISLSRGSSQPRDWYKGPIPTSLPSGTLASSCPWTWDLHPGTELYWKAVRLVYISCSVKSPFVFNHLDISIYIFQTQLCILGVIFDSSLFLRGGVLSPSVQLVAQLCLTLCDTMNCNMPGLSVHQQLPQFTQTHVHWVSDAIQPSHLLSSSSPPALNLSQNQGLFKWFSSSQQVAKVLEFQLQH